MKKNDVFLIIDRFLRKYSTPLAPQPSGGCSNIWITTQEPPFAKTHSGSKKNSFSDWN